MQARLDAKVALVTGAASGIGRATALLFAQAGAKVVVADLQVPEGEKTVDLIRSIGGEAIFVQTDVSKATEVEALINKTLSTFKHLDCAVNNAGVIAFAPLTEVSEQDWDQVININLKGTWLCLKYEIRAMLPQGSGAIVNVASTSGIVGFPNTASYCASKGGVIALTRAAALEYAQSGIRINAVSPGIVETNMVKSASADTLTQITATHPVGRMAQSSEIAEAIVWLCSDAASFVTGHNMLVDGGYTAQ